MRNVHTPDLVRIPRTLVSSGRLGRRRERWGDAGGGQHTQLRASALPRTCQRRDFTHRFTPLHTKLFFRKIGAWWQSHAQSAIGCTCVELLLLYNGVFLPFHPISDSAALTGGNSLLCELGQRVLGEGTIRSYEAGPGGQRRPFVPSTCDSQSSNAGLFPEIQTCVYLSAPLGNLAGISDPTWSNRDADVPLSNISPASPQRRCHHLPRCSGSPV